METIKYSINIDLECPCLIMALYGRNRRLGTIQNLIDHAIIEGLNMDDFLYILKKDLHLSLYFTFHFRHGSCRVE